MLADIYWFGASTLGLFGIILGLALSVAYLAVPYPHDDRRTVARWVLACWPLGILAVLLWPLALVAAIALGVRWLWRTAEITTPRRHRATVDQDYITRLEQELGIGDHDG